MPDNAIQQDANNPGTMQQEQERQLSPRESAMAAIEQQLEQQYQDQGMFDDAAPATSQAPASVPASDRTMVKVKVDGEEKELPLDEVVKGYQKDAAGSRRLEEAAQKRQELEERERQLLEREAALLERGDTSNQQHLSGAPDDGVEDRARELVGKLLEGEVDGAVAMLAEVMQGRAGSSVDESKVAEIVQRAEAQREYERDFKTAKQMFDTDFSDINADPHLARMANDIFAQELEAGKRPQDAAKIAGEGTREWLQQFTGRAPGVATQDRIARKRQIDTLPAASGRSVSSQQNDSESTADVIAAMKQRRGQAI